MGLLISGSLVRAQQAEPNHAGCSPITPHECLRNRGVSKKGAPRPGRMGLAILLPAVLSIITQTFGRVCQRSARLAVGLLLAGLVALSYGCSSAHFPGFEDAPPVPAELQDVHDSVLSRFRYTIQPPGMSGYDPDSRIIRGDCEAWTYAVQVELRRRGIPGGEMYDRSSNPGHAVAYAVMDGDVWILDHRHPGPVFADRLPRFDDVPIEF